MPSTLVTASAGWSLLRVRWKHRTSIARSPVCNGCRLTNELRSNPEQTLSPLFLEPPRQRKMIDYISICYMLGLHTILIRFSLMTSDSAPPSYWPKSSCPPRTISTNPLPSCCPYRIPLYLFQQMADTKVITWKELEAHSSRKDIWIAIDGRVFGGHLEREARATQRHQRCSLRRCC